MTDEGQLYAPIRYKQIANEKYLISRYCNTSYTDVGASSAVFSPVVNITIEGNADENTVKEIDSAIDSRMAYWFNRWNLQMG